MSTSKKRKPASPAGRLRVILFADRTERFYDEGVKIKGAKCIFDRERTEAAAEDGLAYLKTLLP
jgi:hypothetical protein